MYAARPPHAPNPGIAAVFALPVSGAVVSLGQPTGVEDLLLAEHAVGDPMLVLRLAERVGRGAAAGPAPDWADLTVTDADTLIVRLRQILLGDRVVAEMTCPAASCSSRVDISFGLSTYLAHNGAARRTARGRGWCTEPCTDAPGWHVLRIGGTATARYRLPTLADQIAAYGAPDPAFVLAARCIRAEAPSAGMRARIEAAMSVLAPPLAGPLRGQCPDCGTPVLARFEARLYCLQELRDRSRFIYDDVDTLAERYHWSEQAILALPHERRVQYAERARQGLAA